MLTSSRYRKFICCLGLLERDRFKENSLSTFQNTYLIFQSASHPPAKFTPNLVEAAPWSLLPEEERVRKNRKRKRKATGIRSCWHVHWKVHWDLTSVKEVVMFSMTCWNNALCLRSNYDTVIVPDLRRKWISFSLIVGICVLSVSVWNKAIAEAALPQGGHSPDFPRLVENGFSLWKRKDKPFQAVLSSII